MASLDAVQSTLPGAYLAKLRSLDPGAEPQVMTTRANAHRGAAGALARRGAIGARSRRRGESIMTMQSEQSGTVASTGCCPRFDPDTFQDKEIVWKDKLFVKERVHSFLHVPLDMTSKMKKVTRKIDAAHAKAAQGLTLSDDLSPWRSDLYIDVVGPVPDAVTATLSGTFYTHVYEGPYRDAPKWYADMTDRVRARGQTAKKIYLGYTTCPACAKAYGKNYVILFAQLSDERSTRP